MKYTRWLVGGCDSGAVERLMDAGYPYLVASVLAARGVDGPEQAREALSREQELRHSPHLLKDMDKAVARINAAIHGGEKVAIFGDYDVDGITATCLLMDYLRRRGVDCVKHIPRRIEDGYGLGKEAIRQLHEDQGVDLIITVDCGITGIEEAQYARDIGVDLVITDHHECKEELPAAIAVVNPHRPDCPYPFKHLAGVGVALMLVLCLGGPEQEKTLFARYCTLAAIGTIADVMRMEGENRTIVQRGLAAIRDTDFLGLTALLKETGLWEKEITSIQVGFVLAPRINAAGRMGQADIAADLLLTDDPARAEELARDLCALNRERQEVEQEIYAQALEQIKTLPGDQRDALVLGSEAWHQGVVGIVASRLSEKFSCPSFMIHLNEDTGKCSCRSYGGFNLFTALETCGDLLEGFGGHELAAGFTIRRENIPAFRQHINRCVREFRGGRPPVSSLDVDLAIGQPDLISLEEVEALNMLEPYGSGNPRPVFALMGATLDAVQPVGQNRHLKLRISRGKTVLEAIYFSVSLESLNLVPGDRVDAAFHLQVNEFRGSRQVQLQMLDLRESTMPSNREKDCLSLSRRLEEGQNLSAQEAIRLLPQREQFASLWRQLRAAADEGGALEGAKLPTLRHFAANLGGQDPFLRVPVALAVFRERGLLELEDRGDRMKIELNLTRRVSLEDSCYVQRLREAAQRCR